MSLFRVTVLVPKGKIFDIEHFKYLNRMTNSRVSREAKRLYEKTTRTWSRHIAFYIRDSVASDYVEVGTNDDLYVMINDGTPAHVIMNKPGNILAFQRQYVPKTIPRVLNSYAGGSRGNFVRTKFVWHPGTDPRNFTEEITKITDDMFVRLKIGAVVEANRK